jgi:hypothetical protein
MTATVTHERPDEVCRRLDVDPVVGLTSTEVIARRESYGPNIVRADLIDDPYVFTDAADDAEPWKPDTLSQYFGRMRKRVGLDHPDFHHLHKFMET